MATVKELKEQRNNLLDQMDGIKQKVSADGKEARNLTEDESNEFRTLLSEVESIDKQIEENRNLTGSKVEERDMEQEKLVEQRALVNAYIKNDQNSLNKVDAEVRAQYVNTTNDGEVLIPETIANEIIVKMEETSPIFGLVRKYPSVKGTLKIAKENTDDQAGFVGENQEIPSIALKFSHVSLNQKRVGAAVTLTQQLLNDGAIDLLGYSADILARKTVKAIERSLFKGEGGEDAFQGVVSESGLKEEGYNKLKVAAAITADNLVDITNSLNPAYLDQAAFFMSRKSYNEIAKIKDGNGDFLLQSGTVNGRIGRTILGFPVYISDVIEKEDGILFGNVNAAYGVMIKKDFSLKHVNGDTQQTLNGTQLVALDGYMDGAIINAEALVYANTTV